MSISPPPTYVPIATFQILPKSPHSCDAVDVVTQRPWPSTLTRLENIWNSILIVSVPVPKFFVLQVVVDSFLQIHVLATAVRFFPTDGSLFGHLFRRLAVTSPRELLCGEGRGGWGTAFVPRGGSFVPRGGWAGWGNALVPRGRGGDGGELSHTHVRGCRLFLSFPYFRYRVLLFYFVGAVSMF